MDDSWAHGAARTTRPALVTVVLLGLLSPIGACRSGSEAPASPVVWRRSLDSLGRTVDAGWHGEPVVIGDVAVIDVGTAFVALDLVNGSETWRAVPWAGRRSMGVGRLVAREDRIFVTDDGLNRAAALDASDGRTIWSVSLDSLRLGFGVAVDDRALYVGTRGREVIALDARTGAELWRRSLNVSQWWGAGLSGASSDGQVVYVSGFRSWQDCGFCSDLMMAALSASSGEVMWQRFEGDSTSDAANGPTLAGDVVLASGSAHGLVARSRTTGETRWRVGGAAGLIAMASPPLVLGDTVVVGDGTRLYGVRLATGAPVFEVPRPSSIDFIAACAGRILVSRQALDVIDARTGRILGSWLNDDASRDGFVTSGFAVSGDRAVVTGTKQAFGIRCR